MDVNAGHEDPTLVGDVLLAEVFKWLAFEDRLKIVPLVCKSWREASYNPACWREVDMTGWFKKRAESDFMWEFDDGCEAEMEFYIKKVVDRSCGQLRVLRTKHCSYDAIDYISERCPSLTVLSMPDSVWANDEVVSKLACGCPMLQDVDVSDCYAMGTQSLKAFGDYCKSLVRLARNMVRKAEFFLEDTIVNGDDEALVISQHLTNLKHLELKKSTMSDLGLAHIVKSCKQLESLDLACCSLSPYAVEQVHKFASNLKHFVKPIVPRMHVNPKFLLVDFD